MHFRKDNCRFREDLLLSQSLSNILLYVACRVFKQLQYHKATQETIMIYGIIGAMPEEIEALKKSITSLTTHTVGTKEFHTGKIGSKDVVLCCSGIGKVSAAVATAIAISRFGADIVINTGVAGGLKPETHVCDVVIGTATCQHDFDLRIFDYKLGQVPGFEPTIKLEQQYVDAGIKAAKEIAERFSFNVHSGLIISGDQFIAGNEHNTKLQQNFPQAYATEMEAGAIVQAAKPLNKPAIVIRTISDNANETADMTFEEMLPLATRNSQKITLKLLEII